MKPQKNYKRLSELKATAICGNDISSSCLYVSGLAIMQAGRHAWLALLIVGRVLFLYRRIYGEVVGALPLNGGFTQALFLGFCAGMLGISGFESSANFVEEQRPGVFAKTLRNMWAIVTVFNPMIAFLIIGVLPIGDVQNHKETLLAATGKRAGGGMVKYSCLCRCCAGSERRSSDIVCWGRRTHRTDYFRPYPAAISAQTQ